ncbi:uncharacterized protein FOMMEDRAFT_150983 [Fomitiporia mediterranea MF3/22]|uniref:uncharacterized protein n=1 Tax=Fomitiporia mediterranea (strain MF3/22) TaxID=694068 RepID=UPI0004407D40|nr:uncharacterized protein FOMMEDRAFT_150983 [Fomitiporia mediterranea MF3/22]EJD08247.1 hypothetical protein FOMMEDRAFT_150983 [Fomitiporia mediterranea MF3/22]
MSKHWLVRFISVESGLSMTSRASGASIATHQRERDVTHPRLILEPLPLPSPDFQFNHTPLHIHFLTSHPHPHPTRIPLNASLKFMVSLEYLKAAYAKPQPQPPKFNFNPFEDEEPILEGFEHMSMFDFLDFAENPRPAPAPIQRPIKKPRAVKPAVNEAYSSKLRHPRPRRVPAHREALQCFEEMAQTTDCAKFIKSEAAYEALSTRLTEGEKSPNGNWTFRDATKAKWQYSREHGFIPCGGQHRSLASSQYDDQLARISQELLEQFPEYLEGHTVWRDSPHPAIWMSSFVHTTPAQEVVPLAGASPSLPPKNEATVWDQMEYGTSPLDHYEEGDLLSKWWDGEWPGGSNNVDDVEQYEEGINHSFDLRFDNQSSHYEDNAGENRHSYNASEYSGYEADDEMHDGDDGSVYAPSTRGSPDPSLYPPLYSLSSSSSTESFSSSSSFDLFRQVIEREPTPAPPPLTAEEEASAARFFAAIDDALSRRKQRAKVCPENSAFQDRNKGDRRIDLRRFISEIQ